MCPRARQLILLGAANGLSSKSSYASEGLAVAILDALGAKVGPAFLERERDSRKLGENERSGRIAASSSRGGGSSGSSGGGGGGGGGFASEGAVVRNPISTASTPRNL